MLFFWQIDYEECQLRLKEERKARVTAEERVMEVAVMFCVLKNTPFHIFPLSF